ncbi:unnamed protein product [Pedinophyceae sp. YPF-701]|nr:unnamed protein product [Pedinophyceae sp. YPF-701]
MARRGSVLRGAFGAFALCCAALVLTAPVCVDARAHACASEQASVVKLEERVQGLAADLAECEKRYERSEEQREYLSKMNKAYEKQIERLNKKTKSLSDLSFWTLTKLHGTKVHRTWEDAKYLVRASWRGMLGKRATEVEGMWGAFRKRLSRDYAWGQAALSAGAITLKGNIRDFLLTKSWGAKYARQEHVLELIAAGLVGGFLFFGVLVPVLYLASRMLGASEAEMKAWDTTIENVRARAKELRKQYDAASSPTEQATARGAEAKKSS